MSQFLEERYDLGAQIAANAVAFRDEKLAPFLMYAFSFAGVDEENAVCPAGWLWP